MKRILLGLVIILLVIAVAIQLVPVNRTNPPVTREVAWDSPQTRVLARRACFDCHSNETAWPWYSRIAPVSFVLVDHIQEGRQGLNFSEWDRGNADFEEIQDQVREGEMPLWDYLLMHPDAKLSAAEKEQLLAGVQATFASDPPQQRERRGESRGDD